MCLAAVYAERRDTSRELVLDKTRVIEIEGDCITCTSLFGETVHFRGAIRRIDLENSIVIVGAANLSD